MLSPKGRGTITYIAEPGDYKIDVSRAIEVTYYQILTVYIYMYNVCTY